MFIDFISISEISFSEIFNRVDTAATTGENDSLHVSALGTTQSNNVLLSEHIQANRVNTLLVEHNEALVRVSADLALEVNDLLTSFVGEATFRQHQFLSVGSV